MKVVYVAGPFRASTPWDVEQNIRRAEALSLEVDKLGAFGLCPHTHNRFFQDALPDQFFLDGTLELLRRCDAMILVAGWERSSGSRGEVAEANRLGIPYFESLAELRVWLESGAPDVTVRRLTRKVLPPVRKRT